MEIKSENRRRLLDSLEVRCVIRDFFIILAAAGLFTLVSRDATGKTVFLIVCAVFLIFYLIRVLSILRKADSYRFYRAELTQPHRRFPLKSMYFTVVLEDGDGTKHVLETHAIFAYHGLAGPLMKDYVNRTVTIAHNRETGMVVVIG